MLTARSDTNAVDVLSTVDVADLESGVVTTVLAGKEQLLGSGGRHYGALSKADARCRRCRFDERPDGPQAGSTERPGVARARVRVVAVSLAGSGTGWWARGSRRPHGGAVPTMRVRP